MKSSRNRAFSFFVALSLTFSIIMSSSISYADVEKLNKNQEVKDNKPAYKEGELLIKFKDGTTSAKKSSYVSENRIKKIKSFDSINAELYSVNRGTSTQKALRELMKSEDIEYVQPNYIYYPTSIPTDPFYSNLWGLNNTGQFIEGRYGENDVDIDAPEAWDITQGTDDIVVAVIDTGIDINHPELLDRMWRNPGEIAGNGIDDDNNGYIDDIYGWDFYWGDNSVFDDEIEDEHGTHVAGTIAASANSSGVVGVAPNVKIMSLKFLGPNGSGSTTDAIAAIEYAKMMGVKVTNNSWAGPNNDLALKQAIEQSGMLFVTAAGNDGKNVDVYTSAPGSFDSNNILNVAAVNNEGLKYYYSNYGAVSVDVGAPGEDIFSTVPDVVYGIAAVGVTGSNKAFVGAFGLEDLQNQSDADDLLSKALTNLGLTAANSILLVDDDGNNVTVYDNVYGTYNKALGNKGYTNVGVMQVASDISDGPNFAYMSSYDAVIWFTGQTYGEYSDIDLTNWVTTLSYNDRENLKSYLSAGGKLILFGEDALHKIESSDLVTNYLDINISLKDYGRNQRIEGADTTVFESVYYGISSGKYYFRDHLEPISSDAKALLYYSAEQGAFYDYLTGTSMAAPHVTGIAALLLSKNPNLTPAQLKQAIMDNGTPLASLSGKTSTGKMANAFNALKAVAPADPTNLVASKSGSDITLTWSRREAGDFKEYIVERSIDGGSYSAIASTTSPNYTDSGIDTAKQYIYRVKAVDDYLNVSGYSNIVVGNSGPSRGGGGGGGGGPVGPTVPSAPNPSIDSKIGAALNNADTGTSITIPIVKINNGESASMNTTTIDSLGKSGKTLTLVGLSADITIPSAALMTEEVKKYMSDSTAKLSISVKEIKGEEVQKLESNALAGVFKIGDKVFDFTAELKTSKDTINISEFAQELKLSIKLSQSEIAGIDANKLGVYYYNSEKSTWEYVGGVFDANNSTITFDTNHFSKYAVMRAENAYTDIDKHWAKSEIELMAAKNIIEAGAGKEFGPNEKVTRAEVVKMLVNMLRFNPDKNVSLEVPQTATFTDVKAGDPYFAYVETAVKQGITKVGADGMFRPNDTITREQLTTMIIRALGTETDSDMSLLPYGDKDKIPAWATKSIVAAYERGYVQSINGKDFGVGSDATRAQAAVIIKRVMEKSGLIQVPEKLTGKLVISDIEGQHLELETKDGIYVLIYDIESKYLAKLLNNAVGKNIEVSGYVQSGYNIYQRGKVFKVISITVN